MKVGKNFENPVVVVEDDGNSMNFSPLKKVTFSPLGEEKHEPSLNAVQTLV